MFNDFSLASSCNVFFFAFLGEGVDVTVGTWKLSEKQNQFSSKEVIVWGLQLFDEEQALAEEFAHTFQKMGIVRYVVSGLNDSEAGKDSDRDTGCSPICFLYYISQNEMFVV
jgi:hypothetical protein